MLDAIIGLQAGWLSHFWTPDYIQADLAFFNQYLKEFTEGLGIKLKKVSKQRHQKTLLNQSTE